MKCTTNTRKPSLQILALDRRDLPSGVTLAGGTLNIDCDNLNDRVSVSTVGSSVKTTVRTTAPGAAMGTFFEQFFPAAAVHHIRFFGRLGDDTFVNLTTLPAVADGGGGKDELIGGPADESLFGGPGNDSVSAGAGNDIVVGGTGNDRLDGQAGNDLMLGGLHQDQLWGGAGQDRIFGEDGNDSLYGGADADKMDGGAGFDRLVSVGGGIDVLTGGPATDSYWMDPTDVLKDVSVAETTKKHVHKIAAFESYSYDGGDTVIPVSKELNGQNLQDPWRTAGEMELLYTKEDFSSHPLFASDGPKKEDVDQRALGDCWLLAKLAAFADANPDYIRQMVTDLGDGTYAVRFYRNGMAEHIRVDGDLWVSSPGNPLYAGPGREGSIWVAVVEKAWAFFRRREGTFASIEGGNNAIDAPLFGMTVTPLPKGELFSPDAVAAWAKAGSPNGTIAYYVKQTALQWLNQIKAARAGGKPVVIGAPAQISDTTAVVADNPIVPNDEDPYTYRRSSHVYMVDKVLTNSSGVPIGIKLYDPWGLSRTVTDMTRIYFCMSAGGVWNM